MPPDELKWRLSLNQGDFVDALDTQGQWYLAEILEVRKSSREPIFDQFFVKFTEWSSKWNFWCRRDNRKILKQPFSVAKTRAQQDFFNNKIVPDYSKVDTKATEFCVSKRVAPDPVGKSGRFIRFKMPDDNSCLFHSVTFTCEGGVKRPRNQDTMMVQRKRISEMVEQDPSFCNSTGYSKDEYQTYIKGLHNWGGAVELSLFCRHFDVEIIAFDIGGPVAFQFKNGEPKKRVFLVYYGQHYDALVYVNNSNDNTVQEVFDAKDDVAFFLAKQYVELLHIAHFRKDFDSSVEWKGHGCKEPIPEVCVLRRQKSDESNPRSSFPLASKPPSMRRAHSEGVSVPSTNDSKKVEKRVG